LNSPDGVHNREVSYCIKEQSEIKIQKNGENICLSGRMTAITLVYKHKSEKINIIEKEIDEVLTLFVIR
jgi:hypothetical protein